VLSPPSGVQPLDAQGPFGLWHALRRLRPEFVLVDEARGLAPGLIAARCADVPNVLRVRLTAANGPALASGQLAALFAEELRLSGDGPRDLAERLPEALGELSVRRRQVGLPLTLKRAFDVTVAATLLTAAAPLAASTAVALAVTLGRPLLFRQERPGRDGKPFFIHKFRTMSERRDTEGALLPDAERLTGVGRVVRSLSLDEIPQLLDVLKGDMSLVGPRPLLMKYLPLYSAEQARRHEVLPGITGWAAIHGRNEVPWAQRLRADVWYVEHWSPWLDLEILLRTAWVVASRRGVAQRGHVTMSEFTGTPHDEVQA